MASAGGCTRPASATRPHAASQRGTTALHYAAGNGHTDTVRLLIDRGCDFRAAASDGMTALEYALAEKREAVVRVIEVAVEMRRREEEERRLLKSVGL